MRDEAKYTESVSEDSFLQTARSYQIELFTIAKNQNSIVYLGTGSGKTFIATMMIKEYLPSLLLENKKIVFLVPSVNLAFQQRDFIQSNTPSLKVRQFCGQDGVDFWKNEKWIQEIVNHHVLVMIHQVFLDALNHNFISMIDVTLLIFDECHHAIKNNPYKQIMSHHYFVLKKNFPDKCPRILGLSASIVIKKCELSQFAEHKRELEQNLDSVVITTSDLLNYMNFVTTPEEKIILFSDDVKACPNFWEKIINEGTKDLNTIYELFSSKFKSEHSFDNNDKGEYLGESDENNVTSFITPALNSAENKKVSYVRRLRNTEFIFNNLGFFPAHKYSEASFNDLSRNFASFTTCDYEKSLVNKTKDVFEILVSESRTIVESTLRESQTEYEGITKLMSPKLRELLSLLKSTSLDSQKCGIIFTEYREVARTLYTILAYVSKLDDELNHLRVTYILGCSPSGKKNPSFPILDLGATEEESKTETIETENDFENFNKALKQFRCGVKNLIVSTSVLEEGMDIRLCSLVIRFDRMLTYRSYVQSKGRARAKPSEFIIFINETDVSQLNALKTFKALESFSLQECHQEISSLENFIPEEDEIYYANPKDPVNSSRIPKSNAIQNIHLYVSSIPKDSFTVFVPLWEIKEAKFSKCIKRKLLSSLGLGDYYCVLTLPNKSNIKSPLKGPLCSSKASAKRAVAFMAIQKLHEIGELDSLTLCPKKRILDIVKEDYEERKKGIGTKRNRRYYPLSKVLTYENKDTNVQPFLYALELVLIEPVTTNYKNYYIDNPQNHSRKIGILLTHQIPNTSFDLYTRSGKLKAYFRFVRKNNPLSKFPVSFTKLIFEDILQIVFPWMYFSEQCTDPIIVALNSKDEIDDSFMSAPSSDFGLDAIVTPTHKEDNQRYFVEEILSLTPSSTMSESSPESFFDYYYNRYGISIKDSHQPLIRVGNADKHYFMFSPNFQVEKSTKKRSRYESTILIPELTKRHSVPSSFWKDVQVLPFALWKIRQIILCQNLLEEIENELHLNASKLIYLSSPKDSFDFIICQNSGLMRAPLEYSALYESLTLTGAGEMFDLERNEILGDSFLKFYTSVYLFYTVSSLDEGHLTSYRSKIVGNANLFRCAHKRKFYEIINGNKLEPSLNWPIPHFVSHPKLDSFLASLDVEFRNDVASKKISTESSDIFDFLFETDIPKLLSLLDEKSEDSFRNFYQMLVERVKESFSSSSPSSFFKDTSSSIKIRSLVHLSDKSIADVAEALIGTYLLNYGQEGALRYMSWFGINLSSDSPLTSTFRDSCVSKWNSWFESPVSATFNKDSTYDYDSKLRILLSKINIEAIEAKIGYVFREKTFCVQAFTHASYGSNHLTHSYERLEFLGDAVLDYLVTSYIFTHYPSYTPGQVTDARSALVNNSTFASIAVNSNLHGHLLHCSVDMLSKIDEFVSYVSLEEDAILSSQTNCKQNSSFPRNTKSHLLVKTNGVHSLLDVEAPKVLGDIFEALIGAIYLDSGMKLNVVWNVYNYLFPNIDSLIISKPRNSIARIMELFPKQVFFGKFTICPGSKKVEIELVIKIDSSKEKYFRAKGIGNNKKRAKEAAAKCALTTLEFNRFNY